MPFAENAGRIAGRLQQLWSRSRQAAVSAVKLRDLADRLEENRRSLCRIAGRSVAHRPSASAWRGQRWPRVKWARHGFNAAQIQNRSKSLAQEQRIILL